MVTGRTSSFGDINAQNLPRDDRVRSCFAPSHDHVFIDADYATVELATLAQSVMRQLQLRSAMADAINAAPSGARRRFPAARFFSAAITAASASIHPMLPVPTTNISSINAQQQPMQNSP